MKLAVHPEAGQHWHQWTKERVLYARTVREFERIDCPLDSAAATAEVVLWLDGAAAAEGSPGAW